LRRVDGDRVAALAAQRAAGDGHGQDEEGGGARGAGRPVGGEGRHLGSNSLAPSRPSRKRAGLFSRRSLIWRRSRISPRSSVRVGPSWARPSLAKLLIAARFSPRIASALP